MIGVFTIQYMVILLTISITSLIIWPFEMRKAIYRCGRNWDFNVWLDVGCIYIAWLISAVIICISTLDLFMILNK